MTTQVRFLDFQATVAPGETVLDALEKVGAPMPSSCRAGACQFCLTRAVSGNVPKAAQEGLKESLKQTNHFLACVCRPTEDLVCEPANDAVFRAEVTVREVSPIGPDVARVRFVRPKAFDFNAGQFVTLKRADGLARSYSIASSKEEPDHFDVHIRRVANGRLSSWFHSEARPGTTLWLEGPKGDCMYYPGRPEEPLTLVGTGTGIAPLYGIVDEALRRRHTGQVVIYHGAVSEDRLYLVDELRELSRRHANVTYRPCVMRGSASGEVRVGDLQEIVSAELAEAQLRRVYLCGDPGLVRRLKRHIFLAGVSIKRIHADPFIGTDP
jgi:CDP-4-dehydro-6-deoxyglucose reductase